MKQLRTIMILAGALCLAAHAANATDLDSIRDAVKKSKESLRSGSGYFVAAHAPIIDPAAKLATNDNGQPITRGVGKVCRAYWAFSGEKWRFDWLTIFPEEQATNSTVTQVAWDGTNATAIAKSVGWIANTPCRQLQSYSTKGMINPLTTGDDKAVLDEKTAEYVGDEPIDGETTHHVKAKIGSSTTCDLWISPSHGYQTKRFRSVPDPGMGGASDYIVESFKQYDGVWMPERTVEYRYNHLQDDTRADPDVRRFRTLEFHANVPVAEREFRISFPVGMVVTDLGNGSPVGETMTGQELKKEEIQGLLAPIKDPSPPAGTNSTEAPKALEAARPGNTALPAAGTNSTEAPKALEK